MRAQLPPSLLYLFWQQNGDLPSLLGGEDSGSAWKVAPWRDPPGPRCCWKGPLLRTLLAAVIMACGVEAALCMEPKLPPVTRGEGNEGEENGASLTVVSAADVG